MAIPKRLIDNYYAIERCRLVCSNTIEMQDVEYFQNLLNMAQPNGSHEVVMRDVISELYNKSKLGFAYFCADVKNKAAHLMLWTEAEAITKFLKLSDKVSIKFNGIGKGYTVTPLMPTPNDASTQRQQFPTFQPSTYPAFQMPIGPPMHQQYHKPRGKQVHPHPHPQHAQPVRYMHYHPMNLHRTGYTYRTQYRDPSPPQMGFMNMAAPPQEYSFYQQVPPEEMGYPVIYKKKKPYKKRNNRRQDNNPDLDQVQLNEEYPPLSSPDEKKFKESDEQEDGNDAPLPIHPLIAQSTFMVSTAIMSPTSDSESRSDSVRLDTPKPMAKTKSWADIVEEDHANGQ